MNILLSIYMTVFMSMFPKPVKQQKHKYILYNTIYIYTVYIRIYQDIYPFICKWRERERVGKRLKICFRKWLLVIGSKPFGTVRSYFLVNSLEPFRTVRNYSLPQRDYYPKFFPNSFK